MSHSMTLRIISKDSSRKFKGLLEIRPPIKSLMVH